MLKEITFEEIYPMWEKLWPGRDRIKPITSMINNREYDMSIYDKAEDSEGYYSGVFFGVFTDDTNELVAVNSGHQTSDTRFRSRGLYVKPGYGGNGLGQLLLQTTVDFAKLKGFEVIWSLPRSTAFKTYEAVGFICSVGEEEHSYTASGTEVRLLNHYAEMKLK